MHSSHHIAARIFQGQLKTRPGFVERQTTTRHLGTQF
ncbi:Uncharacterised protein [Vibrio cholerae]|uniref:Uncharacterized protein n=1 Tax=Vibrio cholerae TaxID=666 RepID=A0A655VLQ1_VIBCL|nr:Uncharacterised protein [Vibrio cholerae]